MSVADCPFTFKASSDAAPIILDPFLPTVTLLELKFPLESIIVTSSPVEGEAGSVTVKIAEEVLQKFDLRQRLNKVCKYGLLEQILFLKE